MIAPTRIDGGDHADSTAFRPGNGRLFKAFKAACLIYALIFVAYEVWWRQVPRGPSARSDELSIVILIDSAAIIANLAVVVAMVWRASPIREGRMALAFLAPLVWAALWHWSLLFGCTA